ncbi:MAG TPA: DUF6153 family protein [Nocardioidaceae bacterium]|nr:DUF6153 family protein [Nocardioidaceae bacterium]
MLSTKRLLLGLLVLGIVGMHALVTSAGTTAAHHSLAASASAPVVQAELAAHEHTMSAMLSDDAGERDGDASTALALCVALLLAVGVVALAGRRTTWVADASTRVARIRLPSPPVLRDRSPVPRFTVMRC